MIRTVNRMEVLPRAGKWRAMGGDVDQWARRAVREQHRPSRDDHHQQAVRMPDRHRVASELRRPSKMDVRS